MQRRLTLRGLEPCRGELPPEFDFVVQLAAHFEVDRTTAERMLLESLQSGFLSRRETRDENDPY